MTTLWITSGNICTKKVHHFCNMHRYLVQSCYAPVQRATTCFRKSRRTLIQLWSNCPNIDRGGFLRVSAWDAPQDPWYWGLCLCTWIFFQQTDFFPFFYPPHCPNTLLRLPDNLRHITGEYILQIWAGFIFCSCSHQLCLLYNLLAATTALLSYLYPATPPTGFQFS